MKLGSIQKYSGVMMPAADADLIIDWISDNNINTEKKTPKELLDPIENLFEMIFLSLKLKKGFALSWIRGDSYEEMSNDYGISIYDVEKCCQYNMAYCSRL